MQMAKVIILCGPSGCGKSTFAKKMVDEHDAEVVSADSYFTNPETEEYKFDISQLSKAHAECMSKFIHLLSVLRYGLVIVDNTNIARWERMNYVAIARALGYEVEIHAWVAETVQDIWTCAKRNRHGVSSDIVAKMAMNMEISATTIIHKVTT